ncbi:hypothetical protein IFM89_012234 [Coptis chinensis]|uniref:UGP3-like C-terminal hexapeptide repeats domain-containing protein n=1 Tax=Coptis chinensis TaxID=261450 RepID=A0A835HGL6_9MAGN|nr:hypothetical protein IFM89_012234 [Coptis chinensis]
MARTIPILHQHYYFLPTSIPFISLRPLHFQKTKTSLPSFSPLSSSPFNGITPRVSTAEIEYAPVPEDFDIQKQIQRLRNLKTKISDSKNLEEKIRVLETEPRVKTFMKKKRVLKSLKLEQRYELFLLNCLIAAGQEHVLLNYNDDVEFKDDDLKTSSLRSALYSLAEMIENWDGVSDEKEKMEPFNKLLSNLRDIDHFYDCIGGIIGYQIKVLELLSPSISESQGLNWSAHMEESMKRQIQDIHVPSVLDLSQNTDYASQAALWGIEGLPELGEIYPLGGSGDRLGLVDAVTGECLPTAMLPYCGRTLLEGLIRDLQAREFLYFNIHGKQCITPVAIMTSSAKNNHERITSLCEAVGWFGRGRSNFILFEQPLVPAVSAEDGQWLVSKQFTPVCKPGGHGVIWKLAYDKGVFQWFYGHGRKGATVRQVSNVVAATDFTLLALAGIGLKNRKKLGFASCKRKVGATEGINVLIERKRIDGDWEYGLSCIEYTEFDKYGITTGPTSYHSLQAEFPANTNILYIDLASAEKVGSSKSATCLPGMVLNLKKPIVYVDHFGIQHSYVVIDVQNRSLCLALMGVFSVTPQCISKLGHYDGVPGGRLECTMQNIADNFLNRYPSRHYDVVEDTLDSFIVCNERKKVTSSAKRKRTLANKSLRQTPDGSLLDIIRNASDLLSQCDIKIPKIEDNDRYSHSGPPFLILLHPALGPLWEVTKQKFCRGSISNGSELQIEVAEFFWRDVELDGSLIILAENVMGSTGINENDEPILQYGHRCGRCKLRNVKILNKGIDWSSADNCYWKHDVQRVEAVKVVLHGNAEFEATDVVLQGNHVFVVPNGHKMLITAGNPDMSIKVNALEQHMMDSGSWFWKYKLKGTHIHLEMVEL